MPQSCQDIARLRLTLGVESPRRIWSTCVNVDNQGLKIPAIVDFQVNSLIAAPTTA